MNSSRPTDLEIRSSTLIDSEVFAGSVVEVSELRTAGTKSLPRLYSSETGLDPEQLAMIARRADEPFFFDGARDEALNKHWTIYLEIL
jgi:hypothetical protein